MERTKKHCAFSLTLGFLFFLTAAAWGQIDAGNFTISGGAEVGGLPRGFRGDKGKFEEYRDIPETIVVPQLQLLIGGKKEDFYLGFDAIKVGRDGTELISSVSAGTGSWMWRPSGIRFLISLVSALRVHPISGPMTGEPSP